MDFSDLKPVFVDYVEHRQTRRHAYRVAAERIEVNALRQRLRDIHSRRDGSERNAIAKALGHGDEIGHDVEVLESPVVIAGSPEPGLHFVGNAQSAVVASDLVRQ